MPLSGKQLFLEVAVNRDLPKTLHYRLPVGMMAQVGVRVEVPLRGGSEVGFVVSTSAEPPGDFPVEKIKSIQAVLDAHPLLDEERIALGRWIATYYHASLGMTLAAMLPVPARTKHLYGYGPAGSPLDLAGVTAELWNRLGNGALTKRPLLRGLGNDGKAALKRLVEAGHLRVHDEAWAPPVKSKELLAVRLSEGELPDLAEFEKRSPAQARTLSCLATHATQGELVWAAELCRWAEVSHSTLRSMQKKELIDLLPVDRLTESKGGVKPTFELTAEQRQALTRLGDALGGYEAFLLEGITGSGKTEVYIRLVKQALEQGRGAIVLVPEIALTAQLTRQFRERFGDRVALLHSRQGPAQRRSEWLRLHEGKATVALGPRSAVFAPVRNLGLIVMDEEHEDAYKQGETPRYHAREVAARRCRQTASVLLLGSATPAVGTSYLVQQGRIERLQLTHRVDGAQLPTVQTVDLRGRPPEQLLPPELLAAVETAVSAGQQTIILLNRRGFSPFLRCSVCGHTPECPDCSVSLVYHKPRHELRCHYCDYREPRPRLCPGCGKPDTLEQLGAGTQRVEEELIQAMPLTRILRLDTDSTTGAAGHERVLSRFATGQADVLIGTQMVAKGLHFPKVTVVGVLYADAGLALPDYRAAERAFNLLYQVIGRAGRGLWPGRAIIAAHTPEHYAIDYACAGEYAAFLEKELATRKLAAWPPFVRLAALTFSAEDEETAREAAAKAREIVFKTLTAAGFTEEQARLLGPAPAPIARQAKRYRFQLLLKASLGKALNIGLTALRKASLGSKVKVTVDVDPVSLL